MNSAASCHEIIGAPGLYVDAFRASFSEKRQNPANAFILTHYHGDHYSGLPKENKYQGPALIHCTSVTASLLREVHEVDPKFVVEHDYDETWEFPLVVPTDTETKDSMSTSSIGNTNTNRNDNCNDDKGDVQKKNHQQQVARVTFLDANHCPGAAIVFVELPDGMCHLHTGDMRYHEKMKTFPLLQKASKSKKLDLLYLDTTYGHPKHNFDRQDVAVDKLASQVEELLGTERNGEGDTLVLLSCYSIGKEKVLYESSLRSNQQLYVSEKKFKMLQCVMNPDQEKDISSRVVERCTQDPTKSDLHIIPMGIAGEMWPYFLANFNACADYALKLENKQYQKVVAFMPTGWAMASNWNKKNSISTKQIKRGERIFDIEVRLISYSEHSAFPELYDFVEFLRPRKVIPTVFSDQNDKRRIEKAFRNLVDSTRAKKDFFKSMTVSTSSQRTKKNSNISSTTTNKSNHQTSDTKNPSKQNGLSKKINNMPKPPISSPSVECIEILDDDDDKLSDEKPMKNNKKRKRDNAVDTCGVSNGTATLVAMGFDSQLVRTALVVNGNNVELALNALLSGQVKVDSGNIRGQNDLESSAAKTAIPSTATDTSSPSIKSYFAPKRQK